MRGHPKVLGPLNKYIWCLDPMANKFSAWVKICISVPGPVREEYLVLGNP